MTLNSSGAMSLAGGTTGQSVEIELGGNGSAQISFNDANVRTLAGVASGQISMNNFYGKSHGGGFTPTSRLYTSPGSGTETIPAGATTLVVETWGSGGGGGAGTGLGCSRSYGYGGGAGGYTRSSLTVSAYGGTTLNYTVGTPGAGGLTSGTAATAGTASTVSSGSYAIGTQTGGGGGAGSRTGPAGSGGSGSGGNAANTTGGGGNQGSGGGAVAGSGGTYGPGGSPGFGSTQNGSAPVSGAVKFTYT